MIGQVLGHYKITERLGAGGMGEVYRAQDLRLKRDVALKVLPAGRVTDDSARRRFQREALALSRLNHPNIATVFDFNTQDGTDFLVMELVRGETLGAVLGSGPLAPERILRLGSQLADGLAAAHEHGVIHRDLKPANLIVTGDGRLKILDFGIASLAQPDGGDTRSGLTHALLAAGTMPYMAPEQLRGDPADARSDIYSAGIVLYEMATGRRPFPHTQEVQLANAILNQAPEPPSSKNKELPPQLDAIVLQAIEKDPARRYQSALELRDALETSRSAGAGERPAPPARNFLAAAILVVVLSLGLVLGLNLGGARNRLLGRRAPAVGTNPAVFLRRSVAVLGFKNLSARPDKAWISTALGDLLTTELAAGGQLRTVPGETVSLMKINLSLPEADSFAGDTLGRIHKNISSDYVILGSYLDVGADSSSPVRLDVRLQDAREGETVAVISETGTEAQLPEVVARVGAQLRQKLGAGELTADAVLGVRAAYSTKPDAARRYSEGVLKLRLFDAQAARALLEEAVAIDPRFPLAHSALGAAWTALGYDLKARESATRARELSAGLPRELELQIEGRYYEATHQGEKAVDTYRVLFSYFPDNLEYGLLLASAQSQAGRGQEARGTVLGLRGLPAPIRDDPRIDFAEVAAARTAGDFPGLLAASERTIAKAETSGARLLAARGRLNECWALSQLGQPQRALAACAGARAIFAAAGDSDGVARSLGNTAVILSDQGDLAGATRLYLEVLDSFRKTGNKRLQATTLNNLANIYVKQQDAMGAIRMYEQAGALYREVGDKKGMADARNNIAGEYGNRGDLVEARKQFEEALVLYEAAGDRGSFVYPHIGLGQVLADLGELDSAERHFGAAITAARGVGDKSEEAFGLANAGNVLFLKGDLAGARRRQEEALAIRKELGQQGTVAESYRSLASVCLEEGKLDDAVRLAREAAAEFARENRNDDLALTQDILAEALLARNEIPEARRENERALKLVAKTENLSVRLGNLIMGARIRAAEGDREGARRILEAAASDAGGKHLATSRLEAQLALAGLRMNSGGPPGALLRTLVREARLKGYGLVVRKAEALGNASR